MWRLKQKLRLGRDITSSNVLVPDGKWLRFRAKGPRAYTFSKISTPTMWDTKKRIADDSDRQNMLATMGPDAELVVIFFGSQFSKLVHWQSMGHTCPEPF